MQGIRRELIVGGPRAAPGVRPQQYTGVIAIAPLDSKQPTGAEDIAMATPGTSSSSSSGAYVASHTVHAGPVTDADGRIRN